MNAVHMQWGHSSLLLQSGTVKRQTVLFDLPFTCFDSGQVVSVSFPVMCRMNDERYRSSVARFAVPAFLCVSAPLPGMTTTRSCFSID